MWKAILLLLLFGLYAMAQQAPRPQVRLAGNIGQGGIFPLFNSATITMTDTDYHMEYPDTSASVLQFVGTLNAPRHVYMPAASNVLGWEFTIRNATTNSIIFSGPTGTGVTIPTGQTIMVMCDGTNYVAVGAAVAGMQWPPQAGIANFNGSSWGTPYGPGNLIPGAWISGTVPSATSATTATNATSANSANTANALAGSPTQCSGTNNFATGIAPNGNANCGTATVGGGGGVTSLTNTGYINLSGNQGALNISNGGVTEIHAGSGISLSGGPTGNVTITNSAASTGGQVNNAAGGGMGKFAAWQTGPTCSTTTQAHNVCTRNFTIPGNPYGGTFYVVCSPGSGNGKPHLVMAGPVGANEIIVGVSNGAADGAVVSSFNFLTCMAWGN